MRWYFVIISAILLLQLPFGVLSDNDGGDPITSTTEDSATSVAPTPEAAKDGCNAFARKHIPQDFINAPNIILDTATQEQIDAMYNQMIEDGKNAWDCAYLIKMKDNAVVTHLKLPPRVVDLEVTNNPKLSTIDIPEKVEKGIIITKNNKLNSNIQQLNDLRKLCTGGKCTIQEDNECWFSSEISDSTDLDHCSKIRTNLKIGRIKADISTKFTEIQCLSVERADISNLDFLTGLTKDKIKCNTATKITLEGNENLCLSYTQAKNTLSKITDKFSALRNNKPECKAALECPFDDVLEAVNANDAGSCKVITGDVTLDCKKTKSVFEMNRYQKLSGSLTLTNCASQEALGILGHITKIDAGKGVALTLKDPLDNLQAFATNTKIKKALVGKPMLKVENKTQISFVEATKITNVIGEDNVVFSNMEPKPTGEGVCVVSKKETPLPKDCTVVHGDLYLDENTQNVNPDLKEVKGCIKIFDANKLTDYSFLKGLTIGKECIYSTGTHDLKKIGCIPLEVRRSIKKELLDIIMDKNNENNLKCECFYKDSVTEVKESCKIIDGDLIVDKNTQTIPSGIEEVTGCIHVSKDATIDLSFLNTVQNFSQSCLYRQDKSGIDVPCVPYPLLDSISKNLKITSNSESPREDCGECKADIRSIGPECKIVIGHLIIDSVKTGEVEEKMKNVEEVYGVILINNTEAETIKFPALKKIVVTVPSEYALYIYDNKNLVSIEIPALETMSIEGSSTGKTLINIEKNPKWNASKTMQEKVKALTGSDCSDVEGSGCFQKKATPPKKSEKTNEAPKEEKSMELYDTLIAVGSIGMLVTAVGMGWASVTVRWHIQAKKEEEEEKKKQDNQDKSKRAKISRIEGVVDDMRSITDKDVKVGKKGKKEKGSEKKTGSKKDGEKKKSEAPASGAAPDPAGPAAAAPAPAAAASAAVVPNGL